jgi:arsenate reductase
MFTAESAGLEPGTLNPYVIEALKQDGINISGKQAKSVKALFKSDEIFDYVITVCSKSVEEQCLVFPGMVIRMNWPFSDPERFHGTPDEILEQVIELRDIISKMIEQFIEVKSLQKQ